MGTEADLCRTMIKPRLQAAGREQKPYSPTEQRIFKAGRIIVRGNLTERRTTKRADYFLRYSWHFPIAVVEVKSTVLQQARRRNLPFGQSIADAKQRKCRA